MPDKNKPKSFFEKAFSFSDITSYIAVLLLVYFVVPSISVVVKNSNIAILNILILTPVVISLSGLMLGYKKGLNILYVILVGLLYLPTLLIYYNQTAWIYAIIYMLFALICVFFGNFLGNYNRRKKARKAKVDDKKVDQNMDSKK